MSKSAKIQVKLVLLKNELTFWYQKVVLENLEYLQNKTACNNFLNLFLARLFAIYGLSHVLRPNKLFQAIIASWWKLPSLVQLSLPKLSFLLLLLKQQKICKFCIVQACEDAYVKNHPVETGETLQKWISSMWLQ